MKGLQQYHGSTTICCMYIAGAVTMSAAFRRRRSYRTVCTTDTLLYDRPVAYFYSLCSLGRNPERGMYVHYRTNNCPLLRSQISRYELCL
jgi:hypothetical protein